MNKFEVGLLVGYVVGVLTTCLFLLLGTRPRP